MIFSIVNINPWQDGYSSLYLGNTLVTEGDEYHNKIDTEIDSYIRGYKDATNEAVEVQEINLEHDDWDSTDFMAKPTLGKYINSLLDQGYTALKECSP